MILFSVNRVNFNLKLKLNYNIEEVFRVVKENEIELRVLSVFIRNTCNVKICLCSNGDVITRIKSMCWPLLDIYWSKGQNRTKPWVSWTFGWATIVGFYFYLGSKQPIAKDRWNKWLDRQLNGSKKRLRTKTHLGQHQQWTWTGRTWAVTCKRWPNKWCRQFHMQMQDSGHKNWPQFILLTTLCRYTALVHQPLFQLAKT